MDVVVAHVRADVRAAVRAALSRLEGTRVHEAAGAGEALAACREHRPDVALVDPQLCRRDGLHLLPAIKQDPDLFRTSVVLFGGVLDCDGAVDALAHGADDVLREPVADWDALARVRAAARTATLRDQLLERERGLEEMAYNDELTRLYNRRFLTRQLSALIRSATRHERALSLVLVDVDRFKAINDEHGHAKGDAVLARVAERLGRSLRAEDFAGRWGGEEFLVVLPDVDGAGAEATAEKLRRAVARRPLAGVAVTVSCGYATWAPGESADDLLRRADRGLYAAKAAGRDRVHAAA